MSMFDLFRRNKSRTSMSRAASCATIGINPADDITEEKQVLKRCATARAVNASGWGIVPVLNELERRSSSNSLLLRRAPSAKQLLCKNCRRHFLKGGEGGDEAPTAQFCSIDCKSSYECTAALQELVDFHLNESISSEEGVITVEDGADLCLS